MSADDLIKEYKAGKRDFEGVTLRGANLRGANLDGADLGNADLDGADLYDADLSNADLSNANLRGANLDDAYLNDTNLKGATLDGATLEGANLRGANLSNADMEGANLSNADMEGANLRKANLRGADLRGAIVLLLNDVEYKVAGLPLVRSMDKQSNELFIWSTDRGLVCLYGRRQFTDLKEAIKHWSSKDYESREETRDDAEIKVLLLKHALKKWGHLG